MTGREQSADRGARVGAELRAFLDAHSSVNSTAGWPGSPDPSNWRNIRRVCKCGDVIGWHDRSKQRDGRAYPISGYAFDEPHRQHIADVLASRFTALADTFEDYARTQSLAAAYERQKRAFARARTHDALTGTWFAARAELLAALGEQGATSAEETP